MSRSRYCLRQFTTSSVRLKAASNSTGESGKEDSFLYQRLKQLAEDSTVVDKSLDIRKDSLPATKNATELQKLIDKLEKTSFEADYAKEVAFHKIPNYVSKHSKDIALSDPWTGTESTHDANLRMLVDVNKPLKKTGQRPKRQRKLDTRTRLHNAREGSLDYTLSKLSDETGKESDGWAEMYRERLLGPELLGPTSISSTMNSIKALADRRIEDAKARGAFDNLPDRGKPIKRRQNPYLDTTEYHLNNILIRQEIVPPWIEKQNSVQVAINKFRDDLDKLWVKRAVILLNDRFSHMGADGVLQKAEEFAKNEEKGAEENGVKEKLRDSSWVKEQDSYLTAKISALNDNIRGYNLQSPLASQKLYLVKEKELALMFERANSRLLYDSAKKFLFGEEKVEIKQISPGDYLKYDELPQRDGQESLGRLFLNMFKRT